MLHIYRTTLRTHRRTLGEQLGRVLQPAVTGMMPLSTLQSPWPIRHCSANNVRTFDTMLKARRAEARRSVLVQVSSERSYNELYRYCSQFGEITSAHHYRVDGDSSSDGDCHYILLEYKNREEADAAMQSGVFSTERPGVRARSIFMWFRTGPKPRLVAPTNDTVRQLALVDGSRPIDEQELNALLASAETIDDQVTVLHRVTKLNDLGKRLRFLAVRQLESSLQGMFPQAVAHPFGSSVNGYGRMGCDLDVILDLDCRSGEPPDRNARLVYHTKATNPNERTQVQRQLESIGDVLQLFLPGVNSVRRILKARVPIVKYHHEHLDLEIDLTMNNKAGVYMSELLYLFGELDHRVRPLTFAIRRWAQAVGLTNQAPGYWITNFSLTMLVMYFLQQLPAPILPSINKLIQLSAATKESNGVVPPLARLGGDGEDAEWVCSFLKNPSIYECFRSTNQSTLEELLHQFFTFYAQFDFNQRAISLNIAGTILKPDHCPMYIVNPLETVLNVSKNVNLEETELFRIQVRNALWLLETHGKEAVVQAGSEPSEWGLVSLFGPRKQLERITPQMFFTKRMLNVKDIFDEVPADDATGRHPASYRNPAVKNQIASIHRSTKAAIGKLQGGSAGGANGGRSTVVEGTNVKLKGGNTKRR
ncbi:poly(A) RNA polymerase, mitochondrial [Anopheles darlingi]|uniref:poly(A) RNA polymerase, mitochondrial n=1 Tax=Anopheles darlingi TaxID=43151 RepID=UPI002100570A|nr:poly(A) RNA polymerase, mitochondrial [Anopheles darlingi]